MPSFGIRILPLSFNSGCIEFSDWIALLTVCLAPLIAHIASGAPTPTYLTDREPKWYDQLCIYNPTSIIWRYAAITDRRIRAKEWSRQDLAATNAIFWTSEGWDGREHMVSATAPHCLRYPETTYTRVFSLTMFKTIITTLQGVSAVYLLIGGLARSPLIHTRVGFGVDAIFFPLAVLGLLRLSAGAWLTDDYIYQHRGLRRNASWEMASPSASTFLNKDRQVNTTESRIGTESLLVTNFESAGFRSPKKSWGSFVFRICFLGIIWGVWLLALWLIVPLRTGQGYYSVTYFLLSLFYLMFTTSTAVIYSFLFFRGRTTNTILPCISSIWYKLYTVLFSGLTIGLIVVASIETNKSPEGIWTSQKMPIDISCATRNEWWALPQGRHWLGFASSIKYRDNLIPGNPTSLPVAGLNGTGIHSEQQFWLYNFTGYCLGHFENM